MILYKTTANEKIKRLLKNWILPVKAVEEMSLTIEELMIKEDR